MEIAWEDFILEEPRTSLVQPRTAKMGSSSSRLGSRKCSVESRTSRASGESNILFSKDAKEALEVGDATESGNLAALNGNLMDKTPTENKD